MNSVYQLLIYIHFFSKGRYCTPGLERCNHCPSALETTAKISKLRQISLTFLLAKVCEGFATDWVLVDISRSIDRNQYGSINGSSTSHFLIELLDVFYKGTDKGNTVGTLVVTDFSKVFDCIDHTLAIQRLYELGTYQV